MKAHDERFQESLDRWLAALEERHLADLTFPEVRRALQALSTSYVERRDRLKRSTVFEGAGKRAAFAMFYGPLHYLLTRRVVDELKLGAPQLETIVDLGCGTGVASAAWATAFQRTPTLKGIDRNSWVIGEARQTWRDLGMGGKAIRGDVTAQQLPGRSSGIVAGWCVNELEDAPRATLLNALDQAAERGARVLILEPISRRVSPWWKRWAEVFEARGGRADTWRFPIQRPSLIERLDRAAGLKHHELKARTLTI